MSRRAHGSRPSLVGEILAGLATSLFNLGRTLVLEIVVRLGLVAIVLIAIPIGVVVLIGVVAVGFMLASFVGTSSPIGIALVWGSIVLGFVALARIYLATYRRLVPLGKRFRVLEDEPQESATTTLSRAEAIAAEKAFRSRVSELDSRLAASAGHEPPEKTAAGR
jgi:hypothetical protein